MYTFKLSVAGVFYEDADKVKLETLGFTNFTRTEKVCGIKNWYYRHQDNISITFATLQELMEFVKEWGDIVVREDSIIIYNDCLE